MVETIISVHRNTVSVDVFVRETLTNSQNFRLRRAGVPWVGVPWGFQNPQKRGRGPPEHKRECGRPNQVVSMTVGVLDFGNARVQVLLPTDTA